MGNSVGALSVLEQASLRVISIQTVLGIYEEVIGACIQACRLGRHGNTFAEVSGFLQKIGQTLDDNIYTVMQVNKGMINETLMGGGPDTLRT